MELVEHFEIRGYAAKLRPRNFPRHIVRLVQSHELRVWYDGVSH